MPGVPAQAFVVVAPGLMARDGADGDPPPVLASMPRRARRIDVDRVGIHAIVAGLLPGAGSATVAETCMRSEGDGDTRGPVLRADPVHLSPDRDSLVLTTADALAVSDDEAARLAETVNARCRDDGLVLKVAHAERWYLRVDDTSGCDAPAPEAVGVGATFESALPTGTPGRRWRAMLNELQMLLHEHPVNESREREGNRAINSVWLWGATPCGEPPDGVTAWSDHPLVRGAWTGTKSACVPMPDAASGWMGNYAGGPGLVATDRLQRSLARRDADAWREQRASLLSAWIEPLCALLRRRDIPSLAVFADDGAVWALESPRRFWSLPWRRRSRP